MSRPGNAAVWALVVCLGWGACPTGAKELFKKRVGKVEFDGGTRFRRSLNGKRAEFIGSIVEAARLDEQLGAGLAFGRGDQRRRWQRPQFCVRRLRFRRSRHVVVNVGERLARPLVLLERGIGLPQTQLDIRSRRQTILREYLGSFGVALTHGLAFAIATLAVVATSLHIAVALTARLSARPSLSAGQAFAEGVAP